ncbi:MAG: Na/Pi cotransporter family protein, partial [Actinomycetota bacterium]|nr:Na/Pi cotransporter family protein [Actinomycetota bacterium]
AFPVAAFSLPLIGIGFLTYILGQKRKVKYAGQVVLGFGLLFLGMELMKGAMYPLKASGTFEHWLSSYGSNPIFGLLLGILITSIIQSSSATTGIVIAMGASGALSVGGIDPLRIAVPIILGANIGTCVTAFLASIGASLPARRVAVAHYLFNIVGALLFLPFIKWYPDLVRTVSGALGSGAGDIARQVAWSHTLFNVIMAAICLPLTNYFVRFVKFVRRGAEPAAQRDPLFLDPLVFRNPAVALEMVRKEVTRMGRVTLDMLKSSVGFLTGRMDRHAKKGLLEQESIVDSLAHSIADYLRRLSEEPLTPEQSEMTVGFLHAVNDIERIGDHAENIMYLAVTRQENEISLNEEERRELKDISATVFEMYEGIIEALEKSDPEEAQRYQMLEGKVDKLASEYRHNHMRQLSNGVCDAEGGVIFLDALTNLERVGDLANNVGHVVTGELERI